VRDIEASRPSRPRRPRRIQTHANKASARMSRIVKPHKEPIIMVFFWVSDALDLIAAC